MHGHDEQQESMYSYISPEKRVPSDHPLRRLRGMVDVALQEMSPQFAELYSHYGRPSIAPEKLLRALLLQVLYSVRSERLLMEQLGYNLLFRWFVGLSMMLRACSSVICSNAIHGLLKSTPYHIAPSIQYTRAETNTAA